MSEGALVVGAGPAGLMAAEMMARAGLRVTLADAMPSFGRKLLMAGKSGLNLTRNQPADAFAREYSGAIGPAVAAFGPAEAMAWAEGLGQALFTGSTGRVFPEAMKASPLLRAWLARLDGLAVIRRTRWRWTGWEGGAMCFDTPEGAREYRPSVCVLALGGGSWPRLGSTGGWVPMLQARGVPVTPLAPSNAGLRVAWSEHMRRHFGAPVKAVRWHAGKATSRGEAVISALGLEGGGIYALGPALRGGAPLVVDLLPDLAQDAIAERLARPRGKATRSAHLRKALRLDPARLTLLLEFARPLPDAPEALAATLKALPVPHGGLAPLGDAISTAGGVAWEALDEGLMLRALPGTYCAGEMLDWDAPTGGYLITGCLATGRLAGMAAARRARQ